MCQNQLVQNGILDKLDRGQKRLKGARLGKGGWSVFLSNFSNKNELDFLWWGVIIDFGGPWSSMCLDFNVSCILPFIFYSHQRHDWNLMSQLCYN